jgi:predicted aspartyl protease
MADDMGLLRTDIEIESPLREGDRRLLRGVLVDTGAELSWAPAPVLESLEITRRKTVRFQQADGTILERWVGFAIVHAGGTFTNDEVVFGEPGDLTLLGARSLEGLNLEVDLVGKRLVSAGPMLAACSPRNETSPVRRPLTQLPSRSRASATTGCSSGSARRQSCSRRPRIAVAFADSPRVAYSSARRFIAQPNSIASCSYRHNHGVAR